MHIDGAEVFNFVQLKVPPLIEEMFSVCQMDKNEIDYYLFHQPNKFMLKKLADKLNIPYEKLFMNIVETYGNPSGASIPVVAIHNLGSKLIDHEYTCCLSAFGSGLAWGAMIIKIGRMHFCEFIESAL